MVGEQAQEIIAFHKERCFKCGNQVEKGESGTYKCTCGFEWANLFIKRIPIAPFILFKKFADSEFCSDYGMAFKNLIESKETSEMEELMMGVVKDLDNRITKLEGGKPKEITLLSGNKIKGGRENG